MGQRVIYSRDNEILLRLLRERRRASGLRQVDLATKLRLDQSSVSKVERGQIRLDVVQLRRWCRVLNTPFVALVAEFDRRAD